ncbi:exopolyphosphatase [Paraphotobacterium marinum]|uniref:Ppx/GppA phosphatase family protein n=2 Tax=Paraphotobacterium marinum TaxID=1755811 RepID=UPI0039ED9107
MDINKQLVPVKNIAAIDLGSNSFHMIVAQLINKRFQIISRHKKRVHLASGLDNNKILSEEAMERGLDCLRLFAERIKDFEYKNVRIAATYTLREAKNAHVFITKAKKIFPYDIEVLPGIEEARLIYLGVLFGQTNKEKRLVVDIGGGSTELILGQGNDPKYTTSKNMGCVNLTQKFFKKNNIDQKHINKAILYVEQELESISLRYQRVGWNHTIGCSGTVKIIREVINHYKFEKDIISLPAMEFILNKVSKFSNIDEIDIKGLTPERKPVFLSGLIILIGIFKSLQIKNMSYSDSALREGLIYEMDPTFQKKDIRFNTVSEISKQYNVDLVQVRLISQTLQYILERCSLFLEGFKKQEMINILHWATKLHEIGLNINYSGYHKHSFYITQNTPMPGFNKEVQDVLSLLIRWHRKSIKLDLNTIEKFHFFPAPSILQSLKIFRLAIVLNGTRLSYNLDNLAFKCDQNSMHIEFKKDWIEKHKLIESDLIQEQEYWSQYGFNLILTYL